MNISRGFRRLSVLAAVLGTVVAFFALATNEGHTTPYVFALVILLFVVVPAVVVLLLGWAVAGFKNPN
jgi:hypothetical protein